jgi:DsbC/DsbD-like thiol-disulfide interchange protein
VVGGARAFFHIGAMRRRSIIAGFACCLLALQAQAAEQPYRVSLVGDSFDGTSWHTGVLIELDPGWKTYWRMPGEAGIPPEFTWTTSAPAKVAVAFPAPGRHADQSGETVGYEGQALFPVTVTPEQAGDVELGLDLFFAVCKDICIPAKATASITLGSMMRDPEGSARVEQARAAVPGPGTVVRAARLVMEGGKPMLELDLAERPDDIFVEAAGTAYFRGPQFSGDGLTARLPIDNLKDMAKLSGAALTLTYRVNGAALEQTVTLP